MNQPSPAAHLTREPVLNKNRSITANRLVVHAQSIKAAVGALAGNAERWPGRYTVFVSLGRLVPTPDLLEWEIPDNAMIEIPAQTLAHPMTQALVKGCARPMSACASPGTHRAPSSMAVSTGASCSPTCASTRARRGRGALAGLGTARFGIVRAAIGRGYDGASGWFFMRSKAARKALAPSHAQIVRLMNLVRNNADIREIETVLKQDVALSYKLLRHINSVGFGLMCEIQSFRHAVSILGYNKLHKWLSVLLVTASRDPRQRP